MMCADCLRDTREEQMGDKTSVYDRSLDAETPQRQTGECAPGLISRLQCEIYTEVTRMGTLESGGIGRETFNSVMFIDREDIWGRSKGQHVEKSDWRCSGLRFQTKETLNRMVVWVGNGLWLQ